MSKKNKKNKKVESVSKTTDWSKFASMVAEELKDFWDNEKSPLGLSAVYEDVSSPKSLYPQGDFLNKEGGYEPWYVGEEEYNEVYSDGPGEFDEDFGGPEEAFDDLEEAFDDFEENLPEGIPYTYMSPFDVYSDELPPMDDDYLGISITVSLPEDDFYEDMSSEESWSEEDVTDEGWPSNDLEDSDLFGDNMILEAHIDNLLDDINVVESLIVKHLKAKAAVLKDTTKDVGDFLVLVDKSYDFMATLDTFSANIDSTREGF